MKAGSGVKLAEIIAALSLSTDLANDNPPETTLRICLLSLELASEMGLSSGDKTDVYYASLLRFIGCTAYSPEESRQFGGDDIRVRKTFASVDMGSTKELLSGASHLGRQSGAVLGTLLRFAAQGRADFEQFTRANCEVAALLGAKMEMPPGVLLALSQVHERFDGKGGPGKISKERLTLPVRILHVAGAAEALRLAAGVDAACAAIERRAGGQFDPSVVQAFRRRGRAAMEGIDRMSAFEEVIRRAPPGEIGSKKLITAASAFGSFADLKSSFTAGRSSGVAALAGEAARLFGVKDSEPLILAAHLADLGMVSVPTGILEKKTKLSAAEWERLRLHPYYTERILSRAQVLAPAAQIAGMHQERLDGSGYHRGAQGAQLPLSVRILAAADTYHALCEARPHRPAFSKEAAARELKLCVKSGQLDSSAAEAVLSAAGHSRQRERLQVLSAREREVLVTLARGGSNKDIAKRLGISPKTVQHHVQHIYDKIGVSTRAAAALYASENGFLSGAENSPA